MDGHRLETERWGLTPRPRGVVVLHQTFQGRRSLKVLSKSQRRLIFKRFLQACEKEMEGFYNYYRSGDEVRMTKKDLEAFNCTENMFAQMPDVYGQSESIHCRDCAGGKPGEKGPDGRWIKKLEHRV